MITHRQRISGVGTNLKVGGTGPEQKWGPLHFLALKAQLVVLVSALVMFNTVSSVYCLLFFYSRCPPCLAICKRGGACPSAPWSRRHCSGYLLNDLRSCYRLIDTKLGNYSHVVGEFSWTKNSATPCYRCRVLCIVIYAWTSVHGASNL